MNPNPSVIWTALAAVAVIAISVNYGDGPQAQETPRVQVQPRLDPRPLSPGDVLDAGKVRLIERPGQYGLGSDLRGSRYAISDGHLVRVDPNSLEVQSVLRNNIGSPD